MPSTSSSSLTNDVPKPPAREQPATRPPYTPTLGGQAPHSHQFRPTRKMFDKGPEQVERISCQLSVPCCKVTVGVKASLSSPLFCTLYFISLQFICASLLNTHFTDSVVEKKKVQLLYCSHWSVLFKNAMVSTMSITSGECLQPVLATFTFAHC